MTFTSCPDTCVLPVACLLPAVGCLLQALFIRADLRRRYASAAILKTLASGAFVLVGALSLQALSRPASALVGLGLLLGALGDVLHALRFVLPHARHLFGRGAVAFFLGHLAYLAALVPCCARPALGLASGLVVAIALLGWMLRRLSIAGYRRYAYGAYLLTVCLMAGFAAADASCAPSPASLSFAVGAALFLLSDSLLALNAFGSDPQVLVAPRRIMSLSTYYLAQMLIALSLLLPPA